MAQSGGWELNGQSLDEIYEGMQQRAEEHIGGEEESVNILDKDVNSYKDWKRSLPIGLCPECKSESEHPNHSSRPENINEKKSSSSLFGFLKISGKNMGNIKDNTSSSVEKNIHQTTEGMNHTIEDLELFLETKKCAYENSTQKLQSENQILKNDMEKMREENKTLRSKVSSAVEDLKQAKADTARVIIEEQAKHTVEMRSRSEEWEANETGLKEQITDLTNQLAEHKKAIQLRVADTARVIIEEQEKHTVEMRLRSEEWEANETGLKEQITDLTNQLAEHKKEIGELENDLDNKEDEMCIIKKELAEARLKDIVLGIRTERSGMGKTMVDMVHRELSGQLQSLLVKENVRLTVKQCTAATDVPKGLLAVLCLDMSSVGTSIIGALAGIKVNRHVFVIVFHHTSKENLSSLTPARLRITGSELRQLGAIIDMVFSSDSGIYECDVNNTAIAKIASLITKYS